MAYKGSSQENSAYHLNNFVTTFNYEADTTALNNQLNAYGPYVNFWGNNWNLLLKKFVKNGTYIIATSLLRLDTLSYDAYGTTSLWPIIQLFSPQIEDPFCIKAGTEVFVPSKEEIDSFVNYMNNTVEAITEENTSGSNVLEF